MGLSQLKPAEVPDEKPPSRLRGLSLWALAREIAEDILRCCEEQSEEQIDPNENWN